MGIFRKVFASMAAPQQMDVQLMDDVHSIPAIPRDIGYNSSKQTAGSQSGAISQAAANPGVMIGMGLTTLALMGMFRKSFMGDKHGAQKFMQYRVMAQFATVTALVAGVSFFAFDDEIGGLWS